MIAKLDDLAAITIKRKRKTTVAVVEAHDRHTLEAVVRAVDDGIMTPLLIGDNEQTASLLAEISENPDNYEIIHAPNREASLSIAVDCIHTGKAGALMKGALESSDFLRAVVSRDNNLLSGSILSLTGLYEAPGYHKIFAVSDVVVNLYPDLKAKRAIIENAVGMLRQLGITQPKVAILSAVDKPNEKMPDTLDADTLKKMNNEGIITDCVIDGPISFDLATSPEAAEIKGYNSTVAGDADLLIVPDLTSGNILVKCLTGMAGARTAGAVLGAKVPVIFTSRSAEASDKYYSIALAAFLGSTGEGSG